MRRGRGLFRLAILAMAVSTWGQARAVVIHEILYNPPRTRPNTEFIEIYNEATIPYDISEYHFTSGITFSFPEGTRIPAGGFVLVVEDREAFLAAYPAVDPAIVFQYEAGKLDNAGERLALANPGGGELSVVNYKDGGRWPSQADGAGYSLSLVDPFLPTDEVESWAASPVLYGTPGAPNGFAGGRVETPVIPEGAQWKMFKGTQEPSSPVDAWRMPGFADGSWQTVAVGVGYDDGDDATILDDMRNGYSSVYLRRAFDLAALPDGASLILYVLYDDGFVAYLNGTEVARSSTMAGRGDPPPYNAGSGSHEANGTFGAFDITAHAGLLRPAGNVLAIQGHNATISSTDFSLHPKLVLSESVTPLSASPIVFNEFYHGADTAWVELYNRSGSPVVVGGMCLSDDPDELDRYRIPSGTTIPARGFLLIRQEDLPFELIPRENPNPDPGRVGELRLKLYLSTPSLDRVIAARRFDWIDGIGSVGRFPDGAGAWYAMPRKTPGAANAVDLDDRIAISEIMYHPIAQDPRDEYVEIHNRSAGAVDLSGWSFAKGISYVFPSGTILGAGQYLVIAKDPDRIRAKYGIANAIGPFSGGLANDGERIRLCDAYGNPANEVLYRDGHPWPKYADGGGSSLELIDVRQDNSLISAWGASDEEAKAEWTHYEYTKAHRSRIGRTPESEIQFCLLTRGECLLDDIKLTRGGTDYVRNGSFESGTSNWVIQGTHIDSRVVSGGRVGNSCLRVVSSGRGDQLENRIEQQLNGSLSVNQTYTISFWAKWQRGSPWFLTRTHGHGVAQAHRLAIPERLGTPGKANSIARANQGPVMDDLTQDPIRPGAADPVRITLRVRDADGIASVVLRHMADGSSSFATEPMFDDGGHGDGAAGDGIWGGTLPARANRTIVRFYVEATDARGAKEVFPIGSPELACVYQVDGTQDADALWHYRLVHIDAVENELNSRTRMSNHLLPATFIFADREIFHNVFIRYRGSPWTRPGNPKGYRIRFPAGRPLRGVLREINLDGQGQDGTHQHDRIAFWLERKINRIAYSDVEYPRLHVDGGGAVLYDEVRKVDMQYAKLFWPAEDDGSLFKVDDYFEFYNDSSGDRAYSDAYLDYVGQDREEYRWMFKLRSREHEEDAAYEELMALSKFMDPNSTSNVIFDRDVWSWIDVDEWLGHLAIRFLIDDWDGYGYNRGKNTYFYRTPGETGRWFFICWDRDLTFSNTGAPITSSKFRDIQRLLARPFLNRRYMGIFDELTRTGGPFTRPVIDPELDGVSRVIGIDASGIKNFVSTRSTNIRNQIPSSTFSLTAPSANPFVTAATSYEIRGRAPVSMWTVLLNGQPLPDGAWTSSTVFRIRVDLAGGPNLFRFVGLDRRGEPIGEIEQTITSTTIVPRIASVDPVRGPEAGGIRVTILGEEFQSGATVAFGSAAASSVVVTGGTRIEAIAPPGTGSATIRVQNPDGTSGTFCCFTYDPIPAPRVTLVLPATGSSLGGTTLRVFGENFREGAKVYVGGKAASGVLFVGPGELQAITPPADPGASLVDIAVENPDGVTAILANGFFYVQEPPRERFVRGDGNGDGKVDLGDAIAILNVLFGGVPTDCEDALDANDSGLIEISDAIGILGYLFQRGPEPMPPFPDPGEDPTPDPLTCERT